LCCFLNNARGLSGSSGKSFSISSRLSIARSILINEANVTPVEEPFSKVLIVKMLNPDFYLYFGKIKMPLGIVMAKITSNC